MTFDAPDSKYIPQQSKAAKIGDGRLVFFALLPALGLEGVTLILDRPFLYGIVDLYTGVPLFLGTYE